MILHFVFISLLLLISVLLYYYLLYRQNNKVKPIAILKLRPNKNIVTLSAAVALLSIAVYLYCIYNIQFPELHAFMNGEVFIWLVGLGFIDVKEKIIPNHLIVFQFVFWLIISILEITLGKTSLISVLSFSLLGAFACGGVMFVIALIVKSALGMGDVKMLAVLGLFYGLANTYSILLFSTLIMAVLSIILLILKKVNRKTAIPMAPFVIIGFIVNILAGI